ncbi:YgfZ/GcvT domain-containing protein [Acetobacter sp.]|uniref:CAF17-like 4Fe-4S cluster assembly/insertion protein YgfZ n=1 Tax=Acetobacter sp. TaxID=440 RepID=UPI0039EB1161
MLPITHSTRLTNRTVIRLSGPDRVKFLQGLITADVAALTPGAATWAACLTPQGRWQADFFLVSDPDDTCLLLDCATEQAEALRSQLLRFKLRANIQLDLTGLTVVAAWGERPDAVPLETAITYADPRLDGAGWRLIDAPDTMALTATEQDYALHRLVLGLPDGVQDCETGRTLPAEANMDLLGGISWTKGCYMGQEITARMHYRTLLKRRIVPVASTAPLPPPGTPIFAEGSEVGTMRSSQDHVGLALLKLSAFDASLVADGHNLVARPPSWLLAGIQTEQANSLPSSDKSGQS